MASSVRSLFSSALRLRPASSVAAFSRTGSARAFSHAGAASGFVAGPGQLPRVFLPGALVGVGVSALAYNNIAPLTAKCETKINVDAEAEAEAHPSSSSSSSAADAVADLRSRADAMYAEGRLDQVHQLLNNHPATKADAQLLFQLARATHKLSLTTPHQERRRVLNDEALLIVMKAAEEAGKRSGNGRDRADVLALYGAVVQQRGRRKSDGERKQLLELAKEHMTAALREDPVNFHANHALADLHFEMAKERTELGYQSIARVGFYDKSNNNKLEESDQESLWRATARHAYVALKEKPNDLNCINHMAQAKFAIGDLAAAKTYALRALAAEPEAKFHDEKRAAKDAKELMDKINAILRED